MGKFIDALTQQAGGLLGGAVNTGLGLLMENHEDKRQLNQQQKLQDMQLAGSKDLTKFNYEQQLKMWHDTNYGAQMQELKKAGLNPGLIYGTSGGGATTTGSGGANVSGGHAAQQSGEILGLMGMKNQNDLTRAQIENIKAQTAKTQAETPNVALTGKNIQATTENIETETALNKIRLIYEEGNQMYQNEILEKQRDIITNQLNMIQNDASISDQTKQDRIKQIKAEAVNSVIEGTLKHAQIDVANQTIKTQIAQIAQQWQNLDQQQKEQKIHQTLMSAGAKLMDKEREYMLYKTIIQGAATILQGIGNLKPGGSKTFNTNNIIQPN